jgi:hypothetical protein
MMRPLVGGQGFTEGVRERFKVWLHNDPNAKLTVAEEAWAGIIGGTARSRLGV